MGQFFVAFSEYRNFNSHQIIAKKKETFKLTFTTDLKGEFARFTIDSLKWNIKSLIGFNSAHFGPTIFAIKSKDIHWFGVVIFDINNGFERDDFSSIFYDDF